MTTSTPTATRLTIDVWADLVCPWCHLGEARLARAVEQSPHADEIDLRIHTFQLHPNDTKTPVPVVEYLASNHGVSVDQARSMEGQLAQQAAAEGLVYEIDRPAADTLDALRVVQLGIERGLGWQTMRALQEYLFSGNADAFEHEAIVRVASGAGLPAEEVRDVLATDRYADAVRADHDRAVRMGASGVPFTVLGERLGIPGAVSVAQYADAIDQAWEQIHG